MARYNDIMTVELDHSAYSSEIGSIQIIDAPENLKAAELHPDESATAYRAAQDGGAGGNAECAVEFEITIRQRTGAVLDTLPRNETFDGVDPRHSRIAGADRG